MEEIMNKTIKAKKSAGLIINSFESKNAKIYTKGTANYVTQIDYNVEEFLATELKKLLPESNFITVESTKNKYSFDKPRQIHEAIFSPTLF